MKMKTKAFNEQACEEHQGMFCYTCLMKHHKEEVAELKRMVARASKRASRLRKKANT